MPRVAAGSVLPGVTGVRSSEGNHATQPAVRGRDASAKTLVVGLGKTGLSCARYLHGQGVDLAVTDSRADPPGLAALRAELPDVPLFLGGFDEAAFAAAQRLLVSPGVPVREPHVAAALARGAEVIGDVELFARAARAPVAAITGSNGKSTVTSLLGAMARAGGLRVAIGGNLGEPALDLLEPGVELYVLEVSSFQLETTHSLRPRVAAVLNVSADHMDRYPSVDAYARTKARILKDAEVGVINRDDPRVAAMAGIARRDVGFGLGAPAGEDDLGLLEHDGATWLARGETRLLPAGEVPIRGRHNLANALAALAMGEACGLALPGMLAALRAFGGLPHRTLLIAERDGVRWFDDSKGTNPGATIAALTGLIDPREKPRAVLIAGGDCKGADFRGLAATVARTARAVVLIGRDAPLIEGAVAGLVPVEHAADMAEAVRLAARLARVGDSVLLSPGCASFDMFENYEHRGRAFAAAVRGLSG
jgi:UDP-N-acetylmuramoylalanine--D-glutamate ligase